MKLDLHDLVTRRLDWDDCISNDLRPIWTSNFEMIQEINNLKFRRAIVPDDAIDLNIDTIDFADSNAKMGTILVNLYSQDPELFQRVASTSRIVCSFTKYTHWRGCTTFILQLV